MKGDYLSKGLFVGIGLFATNSCNCQQGLICGEKHGINIQHKISREFPACPLPIWFPKVQTFERKRRRLSSLTWPFPPSAVCWGSVTDHAPASEFCRPPCASDAGSTWDPGTPEHSTCDQWSRYRGSGTGMNTLVNARSNCLKLGK